MPPALTLLFLSAYSSTLNMEAIYSSETSVNFKLHGFIAQEIILFTPSTNPTSLLQLFP
jgi:hypothetical protein